MWAPANLHNEAELILAPGARWPVDNSVGIIRDWKCCRPSPEGGMICRWPVAALGRRHRVKRDGRLAVCRVFNKAERGPAQDI
jgi:hypothetical protein